MEDNTGPTTQNSTPEVNPAPQEKDLTFIKFERGKSQGCAEGYHDFSLSSTDISIAADGLTALKVKCQLCGVEGTIEAPLNVNDLLEKYDTDIKAREQSQPQAGQVKPTPVVMPQPMQPQQSAPQQGGFDGDEFMKKLLQ